VCTLHQKEMEINKITVKYSDTSAKLQELSIFLDDSTLLAELNRNAYISDSNVSSVTATMRDKGGVDAATLAKNWGIEIESAKSMHLVTTQRGIMKMINPTFTRQYNTNDRQLWYHCLPVTMFTDTMYSTILSRQGNKAAQVFCTDFGFASDFPMKKENEAHEAHEALSLIFNKYCVPNVMDIDGAKAQAEGESRAYVGSHNVLDIFGLEDQGPESKVKGETVDISTIAEYDWSEWVKFSDTVANFPVSKIQLGRYLGAAIDIGLTMAHKILKANGQVMNRTYPNTFDATIEDKYGSPMTDADFKDDQDYADFMTPTFECYEDDEFPASKMTNIGNVKDKDNVDVDTYDQYVGA
jgi:hypothetical protein